jgi:PAS domain S-box-containing protein
MKNNVEIEGLGGIELNTGGEGSIDPVTIEVIARAIYGQDKLNLEGLKAILDIIPSGIAIVGVDYKFLFVNKRGMEIYGFNYIGWDFREHTDRVRASGMDGISYAFEETSVGRTLLSEETVRDREAIIQRPDGSQIFILCGSAPIFDEGGQVIAAILSFDDITERKHRTANQAFAIKIGKKLLGFTDVEETMAMLCREICEYFKASQCIFSEIDENQEFVTVNYELKRADVSSLKGVYSIDNFLFRDFLSAFCPQGIYIVEDAANDVRINTEQIDLFSIGSFVNIPLVQKDGCRFSMDIFDNSPRHWCEDEIRLMRGLIASIWMYLTRAYSRNALSESRAQLEAELEATGYFFHTLVYPVSTFRT